MGLEGLLAEGACLLVLLEEVATAPEELVLGHLEKRVVYGEALADIQV